ncbi:MAG: prepilin-type N-terminal cleavage/methylation domain-containing protein [Parcubacteria group bacterium]|nr:prepilin-type N-terminal cleavage/methylation domain-containing protein [Parcubacteria group bacterium]
MEKKGFTLIELLIYITTFVIITIILTLFVFNLIKVQTKIRISKEVLENSQRAMDIMLWQIKHAKNIYSPTSVFESHPGQLSLETEKNTPEGEEITYLDFYLDENSRLCLKTEGNEAEPLISENIKINNLVFSRLINDNTESIRIEMSAIYNIPSEKIAYQATTTLISSTNLRND